MRNIYDDEYDEFWENYTEPTKADKIKTARQVREFILNRNWSSLRMHGKFSKENTKNEYGNYGCSYQYTEYIYDDDQSYIIRYGSTSKRETCCPICGNPKHSREHCSQKKKHIPWNVLDMEITNFCKAKYVEADTFFENHYWFELLGSRIDGKITYRSEPSITVLLDREIIPRISVERIAQSEEYIFNLSKFAVDNDLYTTDTTGKRKLIFDKVKLVRYNRNYRNETPEQNNQDWAVRKFLNQLGIWCDWYNPEKEDYDYS